MAKFCLEQKKILVSYLQHLRSAKSLISVLVPPITCGTFALGSETTSDCVAIGAH